MNSNKNVDSTVTVSDGIVVDIIMPAHNCAQTIVASIESVLSQTFSAWRLWIVDDGSTDDTLAVVQAFMLTLVQASEQKDGRIRLIRQRQGGVSSARNKGIALSSAPLLAFIDADDIWLPDKLALQVWCLESSPQTGAVITWLDRFSYNPKQHFPHTRCQQNFISLQQLLIFNLTGNGSNLLVRRHVVAAVGGFNEKLDSAEDWEFAVKVCACAGIACVPVVGGLYRQSPGGASRKLMAMDHGHRKAVRSLQAYGIDFPAESVGYARFVHAWYLARQSLSPSTSITGSMLGLLQLLKAWCRSRGKMHWRRGAGATKTKVIYLGNALLNQAGASIARRLQLINRTRLHYQQTGMVENCRTLANPAMLPALVRDAPVFRDEIQRYKDFGVEYRVPYMLTESIRQIAFDPAIVSMVNEIFGKRQPWVMWGANIREGVPNQAECWHVDSESRYWETVTVVVGLQGCGKGNATSYLPYSHRHGATPPDDVAFNDIAEILSSAGEHDVRSDHVATFSGFGNGQFYAFNAAGWHSGDPGNGESRTLLFLHYQCAKQARIPYMDNYREDTWQDIPAPYIRSDEKPGSATDGRINTDLQKIPSRVKPSFKFGLGLKQLKS